MNRSSLSQVWTDPDLAELLADDPELVAIADALRQTCAARPAHRRRPRLLRVATGAAVAAAVGAVVLAAPWSRGSHAAVLEQIQSALTPKPGWIVHERDLINNGQHNTTASEIWMQLSPRYTYRELLDRPGTTPLEQGGTSSSGDLVFDPATNTLYQDDSLNRGAAGVPRPLTGDLRSALATGRAALAGRITLPGQTIYRIVPTRPQRDGLWIAYVDGTTFRPIRFEFDGAPADGKDSAPRPSISVVTVMTYEYLPPTAANLQLANVRSRHPAATIARAAMPARLRKAIHQEVRR